MTSKEIKIKLAEMLAKEGKSLNDLEEVLRSMKKAEAEEIVEIEKKAEVEAGTIGKGLMYSAIAPAALALLAGGAIGYGGHAVQRTFQNSNDKVTEEQKKIKAYRDAIKQLQSAKETPVM